MNELFLKAVEKGAEIHCSISGGKDGQAMTEALRHHVKITSLIHCDLGSVEWPQSLAMCKQQSSDICIPLNVLTRRDKRGLLEHWKNRLQKLAGTGKPFWSNSQNRYCTSDLKRDVADQFLRSRKNNLVISCEGIRAGESIARAKKTPLSIRWRITGKYYKGMTVEEAIEKYNPKHRLALTYYPIFNWSLEDVWNSFGTNSEELNVYRSEYKKTGVVNPAWPFHPAYVFGNDRVSCMICVLGSVNDIMNGIQHNPELAKEMASMEIESGFTMRQGLSINSLLQN